MNVDLIMIYKNFTVLISASKMRNQGEVWMEELKNKIGDYIAGKISLEEFEDWFVSAYWNVHHRNNEELTQMVYEIELRLAEYSEDLWTEDELKGLLLFIIRDIGI
jgi:hypothetical protein